MQVEDCDRHRLTFDLKVFEAWSGQRKSFLCATSRVTAAIPHAILGLRIVSSRFFGGRSHDEVF